MKNQFAYIAFVFTGALVFGFFSLTFFLGETQHRNLFAEWGGVESATVAGYALCAILFCWIGKSGFTKRHYALLLLILLMGMRELDLHSQLTGMSIFKLSFYFSDEQHLALKLIAFLMTAGIAFVIYTVIRHYCGAFIQGLAARRPYSLGCLLCLVVIIASKAIDGLSRKLESIGLAISETESHHVEALEESLELGIPILILISLLNYFHSNHGSYDESYS